MKKWLKSIFLRKEKNTEDLEKMDVSRKIAAMDLVIDQKAYFALLQKKS